MEEHDQLILEANKAIKTADHLLYITFPVINDKKLFVTILENLYKANIKAMDSILNYDRLYKRIPHYPDILDHKIDIFKTKSAARYNIEREFIVLIEDLKKLYEARKKAPVEFQRDNKYVICSENYRMETLTIERLKNLLSQSKLFIEKANKIIPK